MASNYSALILNYQQTGQYTVPHAKKEGYSVAYNKVWSKNTGRGANGTMVGDIVVIKRTITQQIDRMTQSEISSLSAAIDNQTAFHSVRFFDTHSNSMQTGTFYYADMTYKLEVVKNGTNRYKDIQIELIEQ